MRIRDECLLTAGSSSQPVQDGLVFWLDGQDTTLTDRVQGDTLTVDRPLGGVGYSNADGFWRIYGTEQYSRSMKWISALGYAGVRCVEFLGGFGADTSSIGCCDSKFLWDRGPKLTFRDIEWWGINVQAGQIWHLVAQIDDNGLPVIYADGSLRKTGTKSVSPLSGSTILSLTTLQTSTHTPRAQVGCIRLYDRPLTQTQIEQNRQYEIDLGRITL